MVRSVEFLGVREVDEVEGHGHLAFDVGDWRAAERETSTVVRPRRTSGGRGQAGRQHRRVQHMTGYARLCSPPIRVVDDHRRAAWA
jgi:hypothetical protein